ncbi:T9SS type A sorting domain-containing protein [Cytophaga aurantiaca]|uniref:T9SS type A sorting domain-containing protein n=1 Tax=Cytophaga aurantiaca TaxID=29530 RepID=UPI0003825106|nr:T9SS type A sorting domain-containing protein [Cytophaga aurantiaca]
MKKLLLLQLHLIKRKHAKFVSRLERALGDGSFHTMHLNQKNKLVQRVERVKLQLSRLESLIQYGSLAAVTALALVATDADAQTMTPQGAEFRVNTYTTSNQSPIYVGAPIDQMENPVSKTSAMDANGNFVITWQSTNQAGASSGYDIYAQRYDAAGVAQGAEFLVNTYTTNQQFFPTIGMDASGDFVIAWQSVGQIASSGYDIYAQRYNASGVAQGTEFRVNTNTPRSQTSPAVAMDNSGNFVVAWSSYNQVSTGSYDDVYLQRYDAAGVVQGTEVLVNTYTTKTQQLTSVAMDPTGNFVVTWQSYHQNGAYSNLDIYAKRYNASGVVQGAAFLVNTGTTYNTQSYASVDMDATGNFVIAWQSNNQLALDGTYNMYAKQYTKEGYLLKDEFLVNTTTGKHARNASVAMADNGNFVIAWISINIASANSVRDVYAQRYNASAAKQGGQFLVNTYTTGSQTVPSVAMNGAGDVVISWASKGQDGSDYGVYAQRYLIANPTTDILNSSADSDNLFSFYPNPAKGVVNISTLKDLGETAISISNSTGEIVLEDKQNLSQDGINTIDLSALPAGIYIVKLTSASGVESKKIVIQ